MNKPLAPLRAWSDTKARFTTAEFLRMGEAGAFDDMTIELVEGELERMNPPMSAHAGRQAGIVIRLARTVPENRLMGETGIDLGNDTVLACDAAVLRDTPGENRLLTAADFLLVVEVAQTSIARDTGMKRVAYARAGIAHYWVVDGMKAVVHVYADPVDGDYAKADTVRFGDPLPVPGTDGSIVID